MAKIVAKEQFSEKVFKLVVEAPLIAKARRAGHFVIVRVGEKDVAGKSAYIRNFDPATLDSFRATEPNKEA